MSGDNRVQWRVLRTRTPISLWLVVSEQDGWVQVHEDHHEQAPALRRVAELASAHRVSVKAL